MIVRPFLEVSRKRRATRSWKDQMTRFFRGRKIFISSASFRYRSFGFKYSFLVRKNQRKRGKNPPLSRRCMPFRLRRVLPPSVLDPPCLQPLLYLFTLRDDVSNPLESLAKAKGVGEEDESVGDATLLLFFSSLSFPPSDITGETSHSPTTSCCTALSSNSQRQGRGEESRVDLEVSFRMNQMRSFFLQRVKAKDSTSR